MTIVGSGTETESIHQLALDIGADNVHLPGNMAQSEMPPIYAASDYQLVTLKDRPVFRWTIPSKLGTALSHGCPIITTVQGDVADMCADGEFGFSCAPEDPQALAETFRRACAAGATERRRMSDAARNFYRARMSMATSVGAVESILAGVASTQNYGAPR